MLTFRKTSLLTLILVALMISLWLVVNYLQSSHEPLLKNAQRSITIQLPPGAGADYLLALLRKQKLLRHPIAWRSYLSAQTKNARLKAGEYQITPTTTFAELVDHIIKGQVYIRQFTIIEGWTFHHLLKMLNNNPYLKHGITTANTPQLLTHLGAAVNHPEGLFFPDTYFYTWGNSDSVVLQQAYAKMQRVLQQAWQDRASDLPYQNPYQALIAASLIEKESALPYERPLIAGVIVNRLRKNMRLQIDPSIIYGLGPDYQQRLTHDDLASRSPYNTYLYRGLPPTPIALPSLSSITAALHPTDTKYLFFVARGDGTHQFSQQYTEHLQAVKNYLQHQPQVSIAQASLAEQYKFFYLLNLDNLISEPICKENADILFH